MSSSDEDLAPHSGQINALVAKFGGHQGIDRPALIHYLSQYDAEHLPLAINLLGNVNYFTNQNISALIDETLRVVFDSLQQHPEQRIMFLLPGRMWEGDATLSRSLYYRQPIPRRQVLTSIDLTRSQAHEWDVVVILKDFAGTGSQLDTWWRTTGESLVLPLEAEVVFAVLVLNRPARQRVEDMGFDVYCSRELDQTQNVFHPSCQDYSEEEKNILYDYCRRTGASAEYIRGRGDNGLLVAFDFGCPNNSLPVLWYGRGQWSPLFKRHGL